MNPDAKLAADTLRKMADFKQMLAFPHDTGKIINACADLIESLAAELEQVKRERDAAVADLKDYCYTGKVMCHYCKFLGNGRFCENECGDGECFEWRGVKED